MRCRRMILVLIGMLVASGVAAGKKHVFDPFRIPREQFRGSVKIIALRGVILPKGLTHPDEVKATFDSLITAGLTSAGYGVVPPRQVDSLWKQSADSIGGLYDPTTGAPDTTKVIALRGIVGRALKERFNADAVLTPKFEVRTAAFTSGHAMWDGVSQQMTKGVMGWLAGNGSYGHVPAMSLLVFIDGDDNHDVFVNAGGLQVMVKLGTAGKFADVPGDSLFTKRERNERAVGEALEGLADVPEKKK